MILRFFLRMVLKWPLRLFRWFICVFIFVLVVLGVFSTFFNLNWLIDDIEEIALNKTGRVVSVNGNIKLGLDWVRPSLILNDVTITDKANTSVIKAQKVEISTPILKAANAKYPIVYGRFAGLSVQDYKVGNLFLPVHVINSEHITSNVSGSVLGGELSGTVRLVNNQYDVDVKIDQADYGRLFEGVEGDATLKVKLKAKRSNEINALVRNINGNIELSGGEGKFPSGALEIWTKSLLTTLLPGKDEYAALNCAYTDIRVINGVAKSDQVVVDTDDLTIWGTGRLDLLSQKIDMELTPKPKDPSLLNIATKVHLKGRIGELTVVPDAIGVATKLGSILLGAAVPVAAILPFTKLGVDQDNPCKPIKDKK